MTQNGYQIDPSLPVCWEDLDTLRIGFEEPKVKFHHPSPAEQRIISALRKGSSIQPAIAQRFSVSVAEWHRTITKLLPALISFSLKPQSSAPHSLQADASLAQLPLLVAGDSRAARMLRNALKAIGWAVHSADGIATERDSATKQDSDGHTRYSAVLSVAEFLEAPSPLELKLAESLPQLMIRFTDQSVLIGPLLDPKKALCAQCVLQADISEDRALPVLAAQLVGHTAAAATPESAIAAAAVISATLRAHMKQIASSPLANGRLRIAVNAAHPEIMPTYLALPADINCQCLTAELGATLPQ